MALAASWALEGLRTSETTNQSGGILSRFAQDQNIDEPLAEFTSGGIDYYEADGQCLGVAPSDPSGKGPFLILWRFFQVVAARRFPHGNTFRASTGSVFLETQLRQRRITDAHLFWIWSPCGSVSETLESRNMIERIPHSEVRRIPGPAISVHPPSSRTHDARSRNRLALSGRSE